MLTFIRSVQNNFMRRWGQCYHHKVVFFSWLEPVPFSLSRLECDLLALMLFINSKDADSHVLHEPSAFAVHF